MLRVLCTNGVQRGQKKAKRTNTESLLSFLEEVSGGGVQAETTGSLSSPFGTPPTSA